ncbi:hypothetical protein BKA70DRAFT_1404272 [Coprinopsis sp. MPI-PUGE-AT-0042]|nr:hypothetical protein BKA70DRAFT_1404272 [Coprinopsis sp. MPI-PUGE-AT-0042]
MHQCLKVDEILHNIFQQVFADEAHENDSKSPTVAALARTCIIFSNPALNILWYELYGLVQLFCILPSTKWRLLHTKKPKLGRLPFPYTMAIYSRYYASCIVNGMATPSLSTFDSSHQRFVTFDYDIRPKEYDPFLTPFLDKVAVEAVSIEFLELDVEDDENVHGTPMALDLHESLGKMKALRHFVALDVNLAPETARRLSGSRFSELETLSLGHPNVNLLDWMDEGHFNIPSLNSLAITVPTNLPLTNAAEVLSRISCKSVRILDIFTWSLKAPLLAEFHELFTSLRENFSTGRLTEFSITQHEGPEFNDADWGVSTIPLNAIQRLFRFKNLIKLSMMTRSKCPWDDIAIEKIARAWPRMRILVLGDPEIEFHPVAYR